MTEPFSSVSEIETLGPSDAFPSFVVGIGASAGGLEALEQFFTAMPEKSGFAFVVVQHLSPDFKSVMDELLSRRTSMPVLLVEDRVQLEPNKVYLIPPKKEMVISEGKLLLTDKDPTKSLSLPIDVFFRALAQDQGEKAIAVVLSGTGSDGSRGIVDVHQAGGYVIVQSPDSAKFDGMPKSAIDTKSVDETGAPDEIPGIIMKHAGNPMTVAFATGQVDEDSSIIGRDQYFAIFQKLKHAYNIDFTYYKPSTVHRRIERRMNFHNIEDLDDYLRFLEEEKEEIHLLYKDLLIGVTKFFRDPEAFEVISNVVIPELIEKAAPRDTLRVWVPGCATGEEPYSIAFLFNEALRRTDKQVDVKIFATDIHPESISFAAQGLYSEDALDYVTKEQKESFFVKEGDFYQVSSEIRKTIVFAEQNLLRDPPFTKINFISCRNLLIYFQPVAQKKVLSMFLFALNTNSILLLGPSESLGAVESEFDTINRQWNFFRKRKDVRLLPQVALPLSPGLPTETAVSATPTHGNFRRTTADVELSQVYDELLDEYMPPSVLINHQRQILHVFGDGARYISAPKGRASWDVLNLVDGDVRLAISTAIQRVAKNKEAFTLSNIPCGKSFLEISVSPYRRDNRFLLIVFTENEPIRAEESLETAMEEFDAAEETKTRIITLEKELQFSRENLQATIEELETSNEELQATNEELLASNEELQSTNEELQSVNEELFTVNTEYEKKNGELTQINNDIDHMLRSTEIGTVFVDENLRIRKFTPAVAKTFNLLPQDLGRPFEHITYNIAGEPGLLEHVKKVASEQVAFEKEVCDRDGRWMLMRIHPYITGQNDSAGAVLTFIDISPVKHAEDSLATQASRLRTSKADLERFAYVVSHDLQEPLRTISSYLGLLNKRHSENLDGEAAEFIEIASEGASRMKSQLNSLLEYTRIESRGEEFTVNKVETLLERIDEEYAAKISEKGASITLKPIHASVACDIKQFVALFGFLIDNSLKFKSPERACRIEVEATDTGGVIRFEIADNGIGILEENCEKALEIFRKAHRQNANYEGAGIGLALAKRIILRHGGELWIEPNVGEGARVLFTLAKV